jgi:DNA-binding transcriptional LysR family regulator
MPIRVDPRRFDLTSLRLFVAVAEELSLTKAAERESMVLSAASKRIADLEDAAGSPLLQRHARGVRLTAAGQSFLHHARQVILVLHRMGGELSEHGTGIRGHIRMHAIASALSEFLPEELQVFMQKNPGIKIDLEEQVGPAIVQAVADGAADFGVIAEQTPAPGLKLHAYRTDRLVLVVPNRHPIASRRSLRLKDALDYDFVGSHVDSSLHALLLRAAAEAGRAIKLRIQVRSFDCMARLIQADLGIGVLPAGAIGPQLKTRAVRAVKLDEPWAVRQLNLCLRDEQAMPIAAQRLVQHLVTAGAR